MATRGYTTQTGREYQRDRPMRCFSVIRATNTISIPGTATWTAPYATLVHLDKFRFFSVGVFALDPSAPDASLPYHQISIYLMGLAPRPILDFVPAVDSATRENFEQIMTMRRFGHPFDDVLSGVASPLALLKTSSVTQEAPHKRSLTQRHPTVALYSQHRLSQPRMQRAPPRHPIQKVKSATQRRPLPTS